MQRTTTKRWWISGAIAVVVIGLGAVGWQGLKRSYSSELMDATWAARPGEPAWDGRIVRWNGQPEAGQQVRMESGVGSATETTDAEGRFKFGANGDVRQLTVVGIDAITITRWNCPKGGGVTFDIHLKRPPPPSRGPL